MAALLIVFALLVISVVVGGWLGTKLASRMGTNRLAELNPQEKRRAYTRLGVLLAIYVPATAVSVWALTSGHVGIGIAVLVAAFVLPDFVIVPLRIRRSREAARAAESRRRGVG